MAGNGWKSVYQDEHVKVNVGPRGEVGVWHGATGDWRLQNVRDYNVTRYGRGATMDAARKDSKQGK